MIPLKSARSGSNAEGIPSAARMGASSAFVSIPNFGRARATCVSARAAVTAANESPVSVASKSARSSGTITVSAREPPR